MAVLTWAAQAARFIPVGSTIATESCPNGYYDPGETNVVTFTLKNDTDDALTDVQVELLADNAKIDNGNTTIDDTQVEFVLAANPPFVDNPFMTAKQGLGARGSATPQFTFRVSGACGRISGSSATTPINPKLQVTYKDPNGNTVTELITFSGDKLTHNGQLGETTTQTYPFSNAASITVYDRLSDNSNARKSIASTVTVSGVPNKTDAATGERPVDIRVTLNNVTAPVQSELAALLVGPGDKKVVLFRGAGNPIGGFAGISFSIRGAAANLVPLNAPITTGSDYQPADYAPGSAFDPPAPASGYSYKSDGITGNLDIFDETDVNGTWTLYLMDTIGGNANAVVAGGWTLTVVTEKIVCCKGGNVTPSITQFRDNRQKAGLADITINEDTVFNDTPADNIASDQSKLDLNRVDLKFNVGDVDDPANFDAIKLSGISADQSIIKNGNIRITSTGPTRTLDFQPERNASGNVQVTLVATDPQGNSSTATFTLKITSLNDSPVVSQVRNQASNIGTATPPLDFTVSDVETPADQLTITGSSDATEVVPNANIFFTGVGTNRQVSVIPVAGSQGSANITVHVNDNSGKTNSNTDMTFKVDFSTPVGQPTISPISNQSFDEDTSKSIGFTLRSGSSSTSVDSLQLTASSTRPELLPISNIVLSGTGTERTVKLTPVTDANSVNRGGDAQVTIAVAGTSSHTTFTVHINPVNDKPTITQVNDLSIAEDSSTGLVNFNVRDVETFNGDLRVLYLSSNTNLVPVADGLVPSSDGTTPGLQLLPTSTADPSLRTIKVVPFKNAFGRTTISIRVNDAAADTVAPVTNAMNFVLDVAPVNDLPSVLIAGNGNGRGTTGAPTESGTPLRLNDPDGSAIDNEPQVAQVFWEDSGVVYKSDGSVDHVDFTTMGLDGIFPGVAPSYTDPAIRVNNNAQLNEVEQTVTLSASLDNNSVLSEIGFDTDNKRQLVKYPTVGTVLRFKVQPHGYGDAIVSLTATDNGTGALGQDVQSTTRRFIIRIAGTNNPPRMAAISDQGVVAAGNAVIVPLDIKDQETPTREMVIAKNSSDQSVVRNENIIFDTQNSFVTVKTESTFAGETNVATITLTAYDKGASNNIPVDLNNLTTNNLPSQTRTFRIPVSKNIAINHPPRIVSITPPATTVVEDNPAVAVVTVADDDPGDVDSPNFKLVGSSSNEAIVPTGGILFGGSGASRTMAISPAKDANGSVTITVTAVDPSQFGSVPVKFDLSIIPVEDQPTISVTQSTDSGTKWVGNKITALEDDPFVKDPKTASGLIELKVHDAETADDALQVTVSSSNTTLIPNGNITVSSTGATRTVRIAPVTNLFGIATMTAKVKDAANNEVSTTFDVEVTAVNDAPTINTVNNQTVAKNATLQTVTLTGITAGPKEVTQQITATVSAKDKGKDSNTLLENLAVSFPNGQSSYIAPNEEPVVATLTYKPIANVFGTSVVTVTLNDNGGTSNSGVDKKEITFEVAIGDFNNPPTITVGVQNQSLQPGQSSPVIPITVNDAAGETPAYALVLSFTSDNPTVVANTPQSLKETGSGSTRGVIITANPDVFGTANITAKVTDTGRPADGTDVKSASQLIVVTVSAGASPIISHIDDVTVHVNEDSPIINFTVNDAQTPPGSLQVFGNSDNQTVVPDFNIQFGGSGSARMMIIRPVQDRSGTANISVRVKDADNNFATNIFKFTVLGQPPTISSVADQVIQKGGTTGSLPVVVGDKETFPGFLTLAASSSNKTLVPDGNIFLGGSGGNRTVNVVGAANQVGVTTITLVVTDGEGQTNSTSFKVSTQGANLTNTPPTISPISSVTVEPGKNPPLISFTVGDKETAPGDLRVTATSSNQRLIPASNIFLGGSGAQRTMLVTVVTNVTGSSLMIVTVTDSDGASTSTSFNITVQKAQPIVANDFNKDGSPDIILQDADGFLGAWFMSGDDLLSSGFLNPNAVGDTGWKVVGTADFDNDTKSDLLFQHTDGSLAVWLMDGVNLKTPTFLNPSNAGPGWKAVAMGDFNKDGKADVLFQHTDGTLGLWYLNGTTLTSSVLLNPSFAGDIGWKAAGVGDVNGDGKVDIFFQHTDGTIAVWYMDNATLTQGVNLNPSSPGSADWRVVGVTDQNGDRKPDLLLQNSKDHSMAVWYLNGSTLVLGKLLNPSNAGGTWQIVAP